MQKFEVTFAYFHLLLGLYITVKRHAQVSLLFYKETSGAEPAWKYMSKSAGLQMYEQVQLISNEPHR